MQSQSATSTVKPVDIGKLYLQSNDSVIKPENLKFFRETRKDLPADELRARFQQDGYVLVKGLLPRETVLSVRKQYFELFSGTGLCKAGYEADGIFGGGKLDDFPTLDMVGRDPNYSRKKNSKLRSAYSKLLVDTSHDLPDYQAMCRHPDLVRFIERLTGWREPLLLKRTQMRPDVPGAEATGVHFDKLHFRGGDPSFITGWIPIGDIQLPGGGLIYLEDSLSLARDIEDRWQRAAVDMGLSDEERINGNNASMMDGPFCAKDMAEFGEKHSRKWLVGNFEAGDILLHDAFMVHASATNKDPTGRIRLSTDIRYCNPDKQIDERWMKMLRLPESWFDGVESEVKPGGQEGNDMETGE